MSINGNGLKLVTCLKKSRNGKTTVFRMTCLPVRIYVSNWIFRTLLTAEKSTLLNNVRKILDHMQELDTVPDSIDPLSVEEEYLLELKVRSRERNCLKTR